MSVAILRETYVTTETFIEYVQGSFPPENIDLIKQACDFAEDHYAHVFHPIGTPYIQYVLSTATLLVNLGAKPVVVAAAILYPPSPLAEKILDELKKQFKPEDERLKLVTSLLHLDHLEWSVWQPSSEQNEVHEFFKEREAILQKMFFLAIDEPTNIDQRHTPSIVIQFQKKEKQVENLIRMLIAATTDIHALVIKLVDRLLFMKLLKDASQAQKEALHYVQHAKITLAIYAPLADRLGMWSLKSDLEDMSFRLLDMSTFKSIARQIASKKQEREKFIAELINTILIVLEGFGIKAEISGRAKHIYSIYRKMEAKQLTFEQINDLLGIRIIVDTKEQCYDAQEIIHEFWPPVTEVYDGEPGRDWIAEPKANNYQSLHTTIRINGRMVEVQIRTHEMHEIAEYGAAAEHWRYKESKIYRKGKVPRVAKTKDQLWSRQLVRLRKSLEDGGTLTTTTQRGPLKDRIFVITPEGHVIDLADGATALDFAYRIHTNLGHTFVGAKVNGRFVSTKHELENGDIVELLTSRARKGPNPEWLSKSKLDDEFTSRLDDVVKSRLNDELKGKPEDELEQGSAVDIPTSHLKNMPNLPQWLSQSEDANERMYYVFARTRQARIKIRRWLNKQKSKG